jgi:hypothetical protein
MSAGSVLGAGCSVLSARAQVLGARAGCSVLVLSAQCSVLVLGGLLVRAAARRTRGTQHVGTQHQYLALSTNT